jgi:hypothetical protein
MVLCCGGIQSVIKEYEQGPEKAVKNDITKRKTT